MPDARHSSIVVYHLGIRKKRACNVFESPAKPPTAISTKIWPYPKIRFSYPKIRFSYPKIRFSYPKIRIQIHIQNPFFRAILGAAFLCDFGRRSRDSYDTEITHNERLML